MKEMKDNKNVPGLFLGLCNLDIIYYSDIVMPADNSKKKITDYRMAVGGPAANAAITYSLLGGEAYLYTTIGNSPMGRMLKQMLGEQGVQVMDVAEDVANCNVSCIHVNTASGDRTILSGQAGRTVRGEFLTQLSDFVENCAFVLYDGNLPGVEEELIAQLTRQQKELVLDAGSYKNGFAFCFSARPTVISSESFTDEAGKDVFALNAVYDFAHCAQTRGAASIRYEKDGRIFELPVRSAAAVDTLGAGDIFHGAYCYFKYFKKMSFEEALASAGCFASYTVEKRGVIAGVQYAKTMLDKDNQ